jgi:hypothetical protein
MGPIAPAPSPPNQTQKQPESRKQGKTSKHQNQKLETPKKKLLILKKLYHPGQLFGASNKKRKKERKKNKNKTMIGPRRF